MVSRLLRRELTADRLSGAALLMSVLSAIAIGLGSWLSTVYGVTQWGLWFLTVGTGVWVVTWTASIVFGYAATRASSPGTNPQRTRWRLLITGVIDVAVLAVMGWVVWSVLFGP
jgi:hypothetical protein